MLICLVGSYISGYIYIYNTELFPSNVRGFSVGVFTFFGTTIASLIPLIGVATDKLGVHFLSGFVPFAMCTFIFSFFLPETLNITLQN